MEAGMKEEAYIENTNSDARQCRLRVQFNVTGRRFTSV